MREGDDMEREFQNIVLFPKRKQEMEDEAFRALQDKRYKEALKMFDHLLSYAVDHQEIALGKLTCLIELGRQQEAEEVCEQLIARKDQNYYSYLHIYATLLFQAQKYNEVTELLELVPVHNDIPEPFRSQLEKLQHVNENLQSEQEDEVAIVTKKELEEAVENEDTIAQWHLVNHLHQTKLNTYIELFKKMLVDAAVHPVIKTVIIGLLQAESVDEEIEVSKFNQHILINPSTFPFMTEHPFRKQLRHELGDLEDENPSFYAFSEQLIDRYFYVNYPLTPELDEVETMKKALVKLVNLSLDSDQTKLANEENKKVDELMNVIIQCEQMYFSIMED